MKKKIIIYLFILLIIPMILSVYLGYKSKPDTNNDDLVLYEAENAAKLDLNNINSTQTYITIFSAIVISGMVYFFVMNKKQ